MKHVIIGAGAAGISAAETIRKFNKQDEIVIISIDDCIHSRCMLHHYISGERDEKGLSFVSGDFFAKNNIRWVNGKTVTGLDTDKKLVCFSNGSEAFDKLLIATGADSVYLPFLQPQAHKNVLGLRHLSDARAIKEQAKDAENIVIIGAGLVGMDAAYAFAEMKKKPVVIDLFGSILALNLDAYTAQVYKNKFEEEGCVFHLNRKVTETETNAEGKVVSLTMDSGEKLPCDLVIVAVGTRPSTGFLANSGINCGRGITVNECLETNVKGIYAAGDVTGLSGVWPNAVKQGEVAAKNMCGIKAVYGDKLAMKNTINFYGILSLSLGKTEPDGNETVKIRMYRNNYEKIVMRDGVIVGVLLQGDITNGGFWQFLIKNSIDVSKINKQVFDLTFADFYGMQENHEYEWVV